MNVKNRPPPLQNIKSYKNQRKQQHHNLLRIIPIDNAEENSGNSGTDGSIWDNLKQTAVFNFKSDQANIKTNRRQSVQSQDQIRQTAGFGYFKNQSKTKKPAQQNITKKNDHKHQAGILNQSLVSSQSFVSEISMNPSNVNQHQYADTENFFNQLNINEEIGSKLKSQKSSKPLVESRFKKIHQNQKSQEKYNFQLNGKNQAQLFGTKNKQNNFNFSLGRNNNNVNQDINEKNDLNQKKDLNEKKDLQSSCFDLPLQSVMSEKKNEKKVNTMFEKALKVKNKEQTGNILSSIMKELPVDSKIELKKNNQEPPPFFEIKRPPKVEIPSHNEQAQGTNFIFNTLFKNKNQSSPRKNIYFRQATSPVLKKNKQHIFEAYCSENKKQFVKAVNNLKNQKNLKLKDYLRLSSLSNSSKLKARQRSSPNSLSHKQSSSSRMNKGKTVIDRERSIRLIKQSIKQRFKSIVAEIQDIIESMNDKKLVADDYSDLVFVCNIHGTLEQNFFMQYKLLKILFDEFLQKKKAQKNPQNYIINLVSGILGEQKMNLQSPRKLAHKNEENMEVKINQNLVKLFLKEVDKVDV